MRIYAVSYIDNFNTNHTSYVTFSEAMEIVNNVGWDNVLSFNPVG